MRFFRLVFFLTLGLAFGGGCAAPLAGTGSARAAAITFHIRPSGRPAPGAVLHLTAALPRTLPGRQALPGNLHYSEPPLREYVERGVRYGEWDIPLDHGARELTITGDITFAKRLPESARAPQNADGWDDRPEAWTAPEPHLESSAPEVQAVAARIPPGQTPWETAKNIYRATLNALAYQGFIPEADGAAAALRRGKGDCTDYTDVFVALCRAKNIPARHVSGLLTHWRQTPCHSWAEFYTPENGWLPVDLLHGKLGRTRFGETPDERIYLSPHRNDPHFGGGMLYHWRLKNAGRGAATVKMELH